MTLSAMNQHSRNAACYLRSACKTESDREFVDKLFAHNWEYFVIKKDEGSNQLSTFIECCGAQYKVGEHH